MDFKKPLYQDYFNTQASRVDHHEIEDKVTWNQLIYKKEVIPLLPLDKNSKILDVGCGYGSLLVLLKRLGYKNVHGIDISHDQLQIAKSLKLENTECANAIDFLKDKQEAFDVIVGIDIIEHFSKAELMEFLNLVNRALKENGLAVFRTPNGDAPFGSTYYLGDFTHELVLNAFSAEQIILASGFKDVLVANSFIKAPGIVKNAIRSIIWFFIALFSKIVLFASGKSIRHTLLTPNLIIKARKSQ